MKNAPKGKQVSRFKEGKSYNKERKKRKSPKRLKRNYAGKSFKFGETTFEEKEIDNTLTIEQVNCSHISEANLEEEHVQEEQTSQISNVEDGLSTSSYGEMIQHVVQQSFQGQDQLVANENNPLDDSIAEIEETHTEHTDVKEEKSRQELETETLPLMKKEEVEITEQCHPLTGTYSYSLNLLNENKKENEPSEVDNVLTGEVHFKAWINVKHFLRPPLIPSSSNQTYRFIDDDDRVNESLSSKFFYTEKTFHDTPYCDIASAVISNQVQIANTPSKVPTKQLNELYGYSYEKKLENHQYLGIKTPVLLGQYDIELAMEPTIESPFPIYEVDTIENQLSIRNYDFIPKTHPSSRSMMSEAKEGVIMLEGVVYQSIFCRRNISISNTYQSISEKLVLHLGLEFMQVQSC